MSAQQGALERGGGGVRLARADQPRPRDEGQIGLPKRAPPLQRGRLFRGQLRDDAEGGFHGLGGQPSLDPVDGRVRNVAPVVQSRARIARDAERQL